MNSMMAVAIWLDTYPTLQRQPRLQPWSASRHLLQASLQDSLQNTSLQIYIRPSECAQTGATSNIYAHTIHHHTQLASPCIITLQLSPHKKKRGSTFWATELRKTRDIQITNNLWRPHDVQHDEGSYRDPEHFGEA
jgi:hypothetical protein